jgi:hypothetical protein
MPEEPDFKEAQDFPRSAFVVDRAQYNALRAYALALREREGMVEVPRDSTLTITNISYALAKKLVDGHWGSVYWNKEGSCYPENEVVVTYTSAAPSAGGEKL